MKQSIESLSITTLLLLLPCFGYGKKETLNFFVIGDWGGLPEPPFDTDIELNVSREMMLLANFIEIDFLLALGDNFYYNGVENEYDPRFRATFENVFKDSDLFFPWYVVAGNHDWKGNVSAQVTYSKHSKRWKFPNYFYTILKSLPKDPQTNLAIIMIDTVILCGRTDSDFMLNDYYEPVVDESEIQNYWKYIENELVTYQSYKYIIVAGHYPVWSVSHHGPTPCLVHKLDILLKKYNVTAYINGHDHTLEHVQVPYGSNQSMNYFTIGAANFFDNSEKHRNSVPKNSLKFHWLNKLRKGGLGYVEVTKDFLLINMLATDGTVLYSTEIKPRF